MNLEKLTIEGYKSIGKIEIVKPNSFTVFVGPNASGKSNIFEAIDFLALCNFMNPYEAIKLFGTANDLINQVSMYNDTHINLQIYLGGLETHIRFGWNLDDVNKFPTPEAYNLITDDKIKNHPEEYKNYFRRNVDYIQFFNFTKLFVGQPSRLQKIDDSRLNTYGYKLSNLEKVLKRILKDENKREEIYEILQLLIPGFERVEIVSSELSGRDDMLIYESHLKKPLTKELISDGTFNIISILAALYQSDTPQFLCIEEPENGINPFVVRELVKILRNRCKEQGHYIWLNTHSQTLVSELTTEEMIIVEKVEGLTKIKQIQGLNLHGFRMDDALYTNVIGGGNPW